MIAIIDYGAGNLKNVYRAVINMGFDAKVTSKAEDINNSKAMILPGVGAFGDAIYNLEKADLIDCIKENISKGKYILGICLGFQLFYDVSYEGGCYKGLGLLKGEVVRFSGKLKVPHIGWNSLVFNKEDEIVKGIRNNDYAYFVHSYYVKPDNFEDVILYCDYEVKVPAIVRNNNIIGMQFHPEKSGKVGGKLLKNFGELIK
ncbi:imidazole glycerol phosphate synthase subunit HisH [Caloramator sp. E03]|uniref:imidazole glycerol phosphate synthase subunit HisH n=1 Tax=Caloramator sp. E03 TaxID=2576307 RepID=UPI00111055D8|nr:imidazole glycerol phosphate synthase subunit HisH [Caloramator sp. E03]QCX34563.1 imidazole glycerol phosphate synthase subunit HisH [Caloramator sp. E03]